MRALVDPYGQDTNCRKLMKATNCGPMWASNPNTEKLMINTTPSGPSWARHSDVEKWVCADKWLIFPTKRKQPLVDSCGQDIQRSKIISYRQSGNDLRWTLVAKISRGWKSLVFPTKRKRPPWTLADKTSKCRKLLMMIPNSHVKANRLSVRKFRELWYKWFFF